MPENIQQSRVNLIFKTGRKSIGPSDAYLSNRSKLF
jgi:hypothetical protein